MVAELAIAEPTEYQAVVDHIETIWPHLTRFQRRSQCTRLGLPYPYVVPSTSPMFSEELYYWDSYFTSFGLIGTHREQVVIDMTEDLASLYRRLGVIPNGSSTYLCSRSQPPFFSRLALLAYNVKCSREDADAGWFLKRMMALAEQEHERVWMGTTQPHCRQVYGGLSRYFDANFLNDLASCESGWDHSTRCDDRWLDHLPVDLNSILYARERDFEYAARVLAQTNRAQYWRGRADERAATIRALMWDSGAGFFFDFDWVSERRNPHPSLAGFLPLWAELATMDQAARMVREWLPRFECAGGLVTTLEARRGRQWAYPNGWAPLQWLVVNGLENYGFVKEAQRIREKWLANCAAVFAATGTMWEKYNVVDIGAPAEGGLYGAGEQGAAAGFGWTNGVFIDFVRQSEQNSRIGLWSRLLDSDGVVDFAPSNRSGARLTFSEGCFSPQRPRPASPPCCSPSSCRGEAGLTRSTGSTEPMPLPLWSSCASRRHS